MRLKLWVKENLALYYAVASVFSLIASLVYSILSLFPLDMLGAPSSDYFEPRPFITFPVTLVALVSFFASIAYICSEGIGNLRMAYFLSAINCGIVGYLVGLASFDVRDMMFGIILCIMPPVALQLLMLLVAYREKRNFILQAVQH